MQVNIFFLKVNAGAVVLVVIVQYEQLLKVVLPIKLQEYYRKILIKQNNVSKTL